MNIKGIGPEHPIRDTRPLQSVKSAPSEPVAAGPAGPKDTVSVRRQAAISRTAAAAMEKLQTQGKAELTPAERQAVASMTVADYMLYWYDQAGIFAYGHEMGHAAAAKTLFNADKITVQVDGIDNLKNFISHPSKESWQRIMDNYDANQDGAAGVTNFEGLYWTPFSRVLGEEASLTLVSLAGQTALEVPQLAGFAAGFKLRKQNPVVGYALMSSAAVNHFINTVYPLSTAFIPAGKLTEAAEGGHDFAQVAQYTGVHPLVTAGIFAALLPAEAAGLYLLEKHQESHLKDQMALGKLIQEGKVSAKELEALHNAYPDKDQLDAKAQGIQTLMDKPLKGVKADYPNDLKKATLEFQQEYRKFGEFMADRLRPQVDAAKKTLPEPKKLTLGQSVHQYVDSLKAEYKKDHVSAALEVGSKVGTGAAITYGGLRALQSARLIGLSYGTAVEASLGGTLLGTALAALKPIMPGVGAVMAANSIYQGFKTVTDPAVPVKDKAFAVSLATFSAMGAAAFMVPALAPFLAIGGLVGTVGTLGAKYLGEKLAHHSAAPPPKPAAGHAASAKEARHE